MEKSSVIFGIRAIIEAIDSGISIEKVYLQKGLRGDLFFSLEKQVHKEKISVSVVPVEKLNRLSKHKNHQGAVAKISPIEFQELEPTLVAILEKQKHPLLLVLDQITDVRNLGAILRTAVCCGADAVVLQKSGTAPVNSETVKTSVGAAFKIPICKVDHIKDALFQLKAAGIKLVAATEKTEEVLYDVNFQQPIAIIFGSEEKGIHKSILKLTDYKARLPITGEIPSLNVSVACGAFLYESVRQRMGYATPPKLKPS